MYYIISDIRINLRHIWRQTEMMALVKAQINLDCQNVWTLWQSSFVFGLHTGRKSRMLVECLK